MGNAGAGRTQAAHRASAARARGRRPRRDTSNEVSSASFRHWQRCLQAVSPGSGESANRSHSAAGTFTGANTEQTRSRRPRHARNGPVFIKSTPVHFEMLTRVARARRDLVHSGLAAKRAPLRGIHEHICRPNAHAHTYIIMKAGQRCSRGSDIGCGEGRGERTKQ